MEIIDAVTLYADNNDASRYFAITEVAKRAVVEDMGSTPPSQDDYRRAFNGCSADRADLVRVVGIAVTDLLSEWLEELEMDAWWKAILTEGLDLSDSDTRDRLGEHYLPEPDDMDDVLIDN